MKIITKAQLAEKGRADFLVIDLFFSKGKIEELPPLLSKRIKNLINQRIKELNFKGEKAGESLVVENSTTDKRRFKYILILSLGEKKDFDLEKARRAAGACLQIIKKYHTKTVAIPLFAEEKIKEHNPGNIAQAMTEGFILADYEFNKYKKKTNQSTKIKEITIYCQNKEHLSTIKQGIDKGKLFSQAQIIARNLVNEPPQYMHPQALAEFAKRLTDKNSNITAKILNKQQIAKLGMGVFLAVDQGSDQDPFFIHLTYKPQQKPSAKIVLVGKSITFDSGGLSLKPSDAMSNMKMDMAGGAAVLGIFSALKHLKIGAEIHGLLPACENMPSGKAIKVGDVVKAANGTSIEIANTDAEGRLTLADALIYAQNIKPDIIIDLATLTGAAIVALGDDIAALMGNDQTLENKLMQASQISGEKIWPLPLPEEYKSHIKSKIADIKNIGKKGSAGTIAGGLFLQHFVKKAKWAHLDIAGPAWIEQPEISYLPVGGSGFGVRLLLNFLLNFSD